uniref:Uncharacterized protein n=1 Tax=Anguilla anguilla TaxID=7936 RepID=A0A0E9XLT5_ANGAN
MNCTKTVDMLKKRMLNPNNVIGVVIKHSCLLGEGDWLSYCKGSCGGGGQ